MSVRSSVSTVAVLAAAAMAVPAAASAADPAPRDRTRPVITGFKVTPTLLCQDYWAPAVPTREVSFTLSEDARVRLIKQPLLYGVIPFGPTGVTISLPAGSHTLRSAATRYDVNEPGIFPFYVENPIDGIFGLEAKDAAGNKSATKWSRFLRWGQVANGRWPGTNGC